jgi:hypothetical protein
MKITNTVNLLSSVQALTNKTPAKKQQVNPVVPNEKQTVTEKTAQRIDNNKQAIALLYSQNANKNTLKNENMVLQSTKFSDHVDLDQPNEQNLNAVNAYQSVNNLAQREAIQSLLGVDLFA